MTQNEAEKSSVDFNRRDFIKGASFGSLMLMMGGVPLQAEDKPAATPADTNYSTVGASVSCAVIGCGIWGREVIQTLNLLPNAPVVAICDTYKPFLNKAKGLAPKAEAFEDYTKLLELKNVDAVIIATPTYLHREIAVAALKAGKHVYCEAPLAHTIEDARAIAQAAKAAEKVNFQCGLQMRSDPGKHFVLNFVRSGAIGHAVMARAQWHKQQCWRRTAPTPERELAVNWRLDTTTANGLMGEIGVHQVDLVNWFLNELPAATTGFGGIFNPDCGDGRDVPDTIQSVMQYPSKVNFSYDCCLANSFDGEYNIIYGTYAAIMMRGNKAWLFKEANSPLLGWEIYATKVQFQDETGITLAAGASKSVQPGKVVEESPYADSTLHFALKAFVNNSNLTGTAVKNFFEVLNGDADELKPYLATLSKSRQPAAGYQAGFEATVSAIKANEAVLKGQKIMLPKDLFAI